VHVDPIKPKLKLPGTKRLETNVLYAAVNFCFQIQLAPLQEARAGAGGAARASGGNPAGGAGRSGRGGGR